MSSPPPASPPMVWPPSNPSGTVIPFPLPWGQTGWCPPGGLDALMKCYCDIQQASAFIGQIMLDQINNNPAIIAAIIAGIEKSGSSLPLIGVTNGSAAQPGQVGEFVILNVASTPFASGAQTQNVSMGVLPPGDWDAWAWWVPSVFVTDTTINLTAVPPIASNEMVGMASTSAGGLAVLINSSVARISMAVPTLIVFEVQTNSTSAGTFQIQFEARRAR